MSVIADRLAALQYVQAWTAHVDLEIFNPVGDLLLRRRRVSVFVRDRVTLVFPPDERLGQLPILPQPEAGKRRLAIPPAGPQSGWSLTCSSAIILTRIVIRHAETNREQVIVGQSELAGVTRGAVVVPLRHTVEFTVEREPFWEANVTKILEVSKNV